MLLRRIKAGSPRRKCKLHGVSWRIVHSLVVLKASWGLSKTEQLRSVICTHVWCGIKSSLDAEVLLSQRAEGRVMLHVSKTQYGGDGDLVGGGGMNGVEQGIGAISLVDFGGGQGQNPASWGVEEVCAWLHANGFAELEGSFRQNDIKGAELLRLEDSELYQVGVTKVGVKKRLEDAIAQLRLVSLMILFVSFFLRRLSCGAYANPPPNRRWIDLHHREHPLPTCVCHPMHSLPGDQTNQLVATIRPECLQVYIYPCWFPDHPCAIVTTCPVCLSLFVDPQRARGKPLR